MNSVHGAYGEFFLEYSLVAEYKLLAKQKLPGVYVIPSGRTPLCWNGVVFVRQGLYQGGVFKLAIFIPHDFPDSSCPKLVFDPPVYHPLVNQETGELDVNRAFSKWRRNVNHIWQVLMYARRVFHKVETDNPLNKEAAKLYESDIDEFKVRVRECIERCLDSIYEEDTTTTTTTTTSGALVGGMGVRTVSGSGSGSGSSNDDPLAIRFTKMDDVTLKQAKDAMTTFRQTGVFERTEIDVGIPELHSQWSPPHSSLIPSHVSHSSTIDHNTVDNEADDGSVSLMMMRRTLAGSKKRPRRLNRRDRSASHKNPVLFSYTMI